MRFKIKKKSRGKREPIKYGVKSIIIFSWPELGNIHMLRQHTFRIFLTYPPTMSAKTAIF